MEIKQAIQRVIDSQNLSFMDSYTVATHIMNGAATDAQISALLISLRLKGETIDEISGFVKAMREKATAVPCNNNTLVDTCGTGGDNKNTFNVSTVSGLVAAGAGCTIAKHGNKSVSSRCGSADMLTQLGINININPPTMAKCIDENGFGFLYAPLLHKAMKYAIGPRREIGVRTIFNILGPLTNPAQAERQLIGVFRGKLTVLLANVLKNLGSRHVLVVHGEDGVDEISISGRTMVSELKDDEIRNYFITPEDFGLKKWSFSDIIGGDPIKNHEITQEILDGKGGAPRDMVLLNAGSVIYLSGKADTIPEGIEMAANSIDSGRAREKVEYLKVMTNQEMK
ncbi:MAG: anthranilate phosphoribosyltransferase [bacterium]